MTVEAMPFNPRRQAGFLVKVLLRKKGTNNPFEVHIVDRRYVAALRAEYDIKGVVY